MRKSNLFLTALAMSLAMYTTAFAGSWQQNEAGSWWQNDDGTYPANCWQWIDDNGDGIAESYYFDANGYLQRDTITPDHYTVNSNGAWTVNGTVQTQTISSNPQPAPASSTPADLQTPQTAAISSSIYDGYTVIVNTNTKKYHVPSCRAVKNMSAKNTGYCSDMDYLILNGYSPCKICHP